MIRAMPHLEKAIRRSLGDEWVSPRDLADRLALWRPVSVRHALSRMVEGGECERTTRHLHGSVIVNLYRVKASQPATERGATNGGRSDT